MLVQHRLKTDPNLENQLRAALAVDVRSYSSRRIIRWVCERSRGSLSSRGGAKCAAAGGAEPRQIAGYYYWDFDDNNNKHFSRYIVRNGSGTQKLNRYTSPKTWVFLKLCMKLFFLHIFWHYFKLEQQTPYWLPFSYSFSCRILIHFMGWSLVFSRIHHYTPLS